MLRIRVRDVRRGTLPRRSGNEGWIGVAPRGDEYHLVVPVDTQIARGVMACNRPTDGTPFGGYSGWLYFRCEPYDEEGRDEDTARGEQVRTNCESLEKFLRAYGIVCELQIGEPDHTEGMPRTENRSDTQAPQRLECSACGRSWEEIAELLRDPDLKLDRYRACLEDFSQGTYVFSHGGCGGLVTVPALRFVRPRSRGRSLIGSHACPGLCYYETSLLACSAKCEGSCYRRVAEKLRSRTAD